MEPTNHSPASGGSNVNPGGSGEIPNKNDPNEAPTSKDSVSYESFKKVLDEKKSVQDRMKSLEDELNKFRSEEKKREEAKLREKEDWKKLLEQREQELTDYKQKFEGLNTQITEGRKLSAVLSQITGEVPDHYLGLISTDDVAVDPETGMPDTASALRVAKEFEKRYPEVIKRRAANGLPANAPQGGNSKLTIDEWKKLPYEERKKNIGRVDTSSLG